MQIMGCIRKKTDWEQKFLVSCILYVDTRKAGKTDDLEASVNYGTISHLIKEKMEEKNYRLIEAVAEQLAEEILLFDEKIRKVMVEVKKPWAPVGLPLETVSVKIERAGMKRLSHSDRIWVIRKNTLRMR